MASITGREYRILWACFLNTVQGSDLDSTTVYLGKGGDLHVLYAVHCILQHNLADGTPSIFSTKYLRLNSKPLSR